MTGTQMQRGRAIGQGTVSAPGSCGELAQGMLEGTYVLVTCPVDFYATATVETLHGQGRVFGPSDSPKACRAVELTLAYIGRSDVDVRLSLKSPLPRGKGMASSTADVLVAMGATATALDVQLSLHDQARLALQVEPSDGLMLPGIALFDYRSGSVARPLGQPPAMQVLILDFGGTAETVAFNAVDRSALLHRLEPRFREALDLLVEGLRTQDVHRIGQGAVLSATAHQEVLPKPQLETVLAFARETGAAGVNVAHSGTVLGILFPDDPDRVAWARRIARERLPRLHAVYQHRLIGGGVVSGWAPVQEVLR